MRKIAENYELPYYTLSPTYSVCKDHGYISGEQFTCPICGNKTEVYSRITGYYRPVQNWNDGKTQEFKDRKLYDLTKSRFVMKVKGSDLGITAGKEETQQPEPAQSQNLLFTTHTCPNCQIAIRALDQAGVGYTRIYAEDEPELAKQYGIVAAPTLVLADGRELAGASNIVAFTRTAVHA